MTIGVRILVAIRPLGSLSVGWLAWYDDLRRNGSTENGGEIDLNPATLFGCYSQTAAPVGIRRLRAMNLPRMGQSPEWNCGTGGNRALGAVTSDS